jgi:hypothetical protein
MAAAVATTATLQSHCKAATILNCCSHSSKSDRRTHPKVFMVILFLEELTNREFAQLSKAP